MICPILSAGQPENWECEEKNCAWWDPGKACCVVLALEAVLGAILALLPK